jgi:hypothetical protein
MTMLIDDGGEIIESRSRRYTRGKRVGKQKKAHAPALRNGT